MNEFFFFFWKMFSLSSDLVENVWWKKNSRVFMAQKKYISRVPLKKKKKNMNSFHFFKYNKTQPICKPFWRQNYSKSSINNKRLAIAFQAVDIHDDKNEIIIFFFASPSRGNANNSFRAHRCLVHATSIPILQSKGFSFFVSAVKRNWKKKFPRNCSNFMSFQWNLTVMLIFFLKAFQPLKKIIEKFSAVFQNWNTKKKIAIYYKNRKKREVEFLMSDFKISCRKFL